MIRILPRQRRKVGLDSFSLHAIQRRRLSQQHGERPEIRDEVVNGQKQDVLLLCPSKDAQAQQRPLFQIKGLLGLFNQPFAQPCFAQAEASCS